MKQVSQGAQFEDVCGSLCANVVSDAIASTEVAVCCSPRQEAINGGSSDVCSGTV